MTLWATVAIALRALRANKLRTVLTMLGIIIGVGAVITMVSVGAGAQARIAEQIESLGSNLMIVLSGSVTSGGVRLGAGSQRSITEDDALAIQREVPYVAAAAPGERGGGLVVYGNMNWYTVVGGVVPEFFEVREWEVVSGRPITREDVDGTAKVAVVGQTVARTLFGETDPVGLVVRIKNVPLRVIGVLDRKGQSARGQDQDDVVLIPLSTARKKVLGYMHSTPRAVGAIMIKIREAREMHLAEQQIRDLLRQRHRLQGNQPDDFSLLNLTEILQTREESSKVLTILLAAIASVSLLVGGIGIMNIMLVSVTERTREIGLRMAVGARGRDILTQFLIEAITVSLIGGGIGIAFGVTGSFVVAYLAKWNTLIQAEAILLAFGFSLAVGVFFGFYPAQKASRLDPIEALRYE